MLDFVDWKTIVVVGIGVTFASSVTKWVIGYAKAKLTKWRDIERKEEAAQLVSGVFACRSKEECDSRLGAAVSEGQEPLRLEVQALGTQVGQEMKRVNKKLDNMASKDDIRAVHERIDDYMKAVAMNAIVGGNPSES